MLNVKRDNAGLLAVNMSCNCGFEQGKTFSGMGSGVERYRIILTLFNIC